MPGRPDLLRGHTGRTDQGLLRAQGQSDNRDRGRNRRDPDAAGGGRLRAGQLDAVAHARSVLCHHHTERLAQVRPRPPRADGRGRGGRGPGRRSRVARRPRHRRAGRERRSRHQERPQGGLRAFQVVVQELPSGRRLSRLPVTVTAATTTTIINITIDRILLAYARDGRFSARTPSHFGPFTRVESRLRSSRSKNNNKSVRRSVFFFFLVVFVN